MEPIWHHDPTHLAQRIERRAHIVGGCAGAMNPEGLTRESNDGSSRSQANTAEPDRTFGDPDGVWHDHFEDAGSCHQGTIPFLESLCGKSRRSRGRLTEAPLVVFLPPSA